MRVEVDISPEVIVVLRKKYGYKYASWFVRDAVRRLLREYGLIK